MRHVVVNGANGYVASHFISALLKRGLVVTALVRAGRQQSALERVSAALLAANGDLCLPMDKLRVKEYSLHEKNLGLDSQEAARIFSGRVDYYHFAASLKYDEKSWKEIYAANVEGLENSLKTFTAHAGSEGRFFYVGTAYSCGHHQGLFRESFYPDAAISAFRNYYELSKRMGENLVRTFIEEHGLAAHVLRLSQVVGDSSNGQVATDYGVFDFTRRMARLARRYPQRKVRVKIDPNGSQNLIPVNQVVAHLLRSTETDELPVVMHIVAREGVSNSYILRQLNELLPIDLQAEPQLKQQDMDAVERLVAVGMSFTGEYSRLNLHFDTGQRDRVMGAEAGVVTPDDVGRMLRTFVAAGNYAEAGSV